MPTISRPVSHASNPAASLLGFAFIFVLLGVPAFIGYYIYSAYEEKHAGNLTAKESWAYERVEFFLLNNAHNNVDLDRHFSNTPIWSDSCPQGSIGVRVVAPVINPTDGHASDVTMLFCVDHSGAVTADNPEGRYLTNQEAGQ